MLLWATNSVFMLAGSCTHELVVSRAIIPPAIETVSKINTTESKITMRMLDDKRRLRLRVAILKVIAERERGLCLFSLTIP